MAPNFSDEKGAVWQLISHCLTFSSLAAISSLMRDRHPVPLSDISGAFILSGACGLAIGIAMLPSLAIAPLLLLLATSGLLRAFENGGAGYCRGG